MKTIAIYTLVSPLHDAEAVEAATQEFLASIDVKFELKGNDYADYGTHALDLIYVCTGGTEGLLRELLPTLRGKSSQPFFLLTSGKSNSLAASMEILSYLRKKGIKGEIIHGSAPYVTQRLNLLSHVGEARRQLHGCRLGIIGKPSDWLISSTIDAEAVRAALGIELVNIKMEELLATIETIAEPAADEMAAEAPSPDVEQSIPGAIKIYAALKEIVARHHLQGFTIRCFDLLTSVRNTGCVALARLNAEGIAAGCEGDVPALLSMMIARAVAGVSGFQANPSRINPETGEMLFAHCTIPLDMVESYELDTHFESGIGVGIRGYMRQGDVTIFKVSGDLSRHFAQEGTLERNQKEPGLCRTQQVIRLADPRQASHFLTDPIGNHHIIVPGHCKALLDAILD